MVVNIWKYQNWVYEFQKVKVLPLWCFYLKTSNKKCQSECRSVNRSHSLSQTCKIPASKFVPSEFLLSVLTFRNLCWIKSVFLTLEKSLWQHLILVCTQWKFIKHLNLHGGNFYNKSTSSANKIPSYSFAFKTLSRDWTAPFLVCTGWRLSNSTTCFVVLRSVLQGQFNITRMSCLLSGFTYPKINNQVTWSHEAERITQ